MANVLFIKTSSLGDVVHHMPALTEAKARRPDHRFAWVVEEAFAPLVRLHPAIDQVIPVAMRRWRRGLFAGGAMGEAAAFARDLREQRYDAIIDTQGLALKSALLARLAKGERHGYDPNSIKEPMSCVFYDKTHRVAWAEHAITRNRALTGLALGYTPEGAPQFGLDRARLVEPSAAPYAVLLHGTARDDKQWPEVNWRLLAAALGAEIDVVVLFGSNDERGRAERIAAATSRARVPAGAPLDQVAKLLAGAAFVVGVDTGLLHLAAALQVPLVGIFGASDPALTGPRGAGRIEVVGRNGEFPAAGDVVEAVERVRA